MKKIIFLLFIAVFLNPKNTYALASASQIVVNQSFVEKIPESKKEILKKKIIHFVKKYFGEVKPKSNFDKISLICGITGYLFILASILFTVYSHLYVLPDILLTLGLFFLLVGVILGLIFIGQFDIKDKKIKLNKAIWGIVLGSLPIIFSLIALTIFFFF
jgi:hypothetical protein